MCFKSHFKELEDSSGLLNNPESLRARMRNEGYLFFRGFLKTEPLLDLRARILSVLSQHGKVKIEAFTADEAFIGEPFAEVLGDYFKIYDDVQKLESLHTLKHDPLLMNLMEKVLNKPAFAHPLAIARIICPQYMDYTTPAHQDYPNNQGSLETYAVWIPLGNCPVELGGLAVLERSHLFGILMNESALGAGYKKVVLKAPMNELNWWTTNYKAGDALVFHSLTVHRALPNKTADRVRLSVDYRYQNLREPITDNSLKPHFQRLSWEDIYAGWSSTRFQYYWKKFELRETAWDPTIEALRLKKVLGE